MTTPFQMTFVANDPQQLRVNIEKFLTAFGDQPVSQMELDFDRRVESHQTPIGEQETITSPKQADPVVTKKKSKAKAASAKKAEPVPEELAVEEPVDDSPLEEEVSAAPVTYTREQVTAVLTEFNAKHGLEEARKLLARFSAARLSELSEDQYSAFVKAASEVQ